MNGFTKLPTNRYVNNNTDCKLFKSSLKLRFNTTKPLWQNEKLHNNLKEASEVTIANDIFSSELFHKLQLKHPRIHSILINCAKNVKCNFKKFRLGRLMSDTLPNHKNITPKRAASSTVTMNQCRTFLIKAIRLVFGQNIANDYQIYKFVCLLLKILCGHIPSRNPTKVELHLFKQLLHTQLQLATKLPSAFRKEFGRSCVICFIKFCCNILSHCFYVTMSKVSGTLQVVFYQRGVWNKIQNFAFVQLSVRQGLKKVVLDKEKPVSRLKLLPKSTSLRPIGVALNKFDPLKIRNARLVLRYLCAQNFPYALNEFRTKFIATAKQASTSKLYYCTGDIIDCFNKIDYTIISKFLSNFGLDQVFHIATKTSTDQFRRIAFGVGREKEEACKNLQSMFINGITGIKLDYVTVTGQELRKLLRDYAFRPQIYFAGNHYRFSRGVLQGGPMSSLINEIFLLSVETKIFANHVMNKELVYHRHVDDYIFFSSNKNIITSVIVKLMEGKLRFKTGNTDDLPLPFPRFSYSKVLINFNSPVLARFNLQKSRHFPFCGNVLNSRHHSISIDYKRYERDPKNANRCFALSNRLHNVRKLFADNIKFMINYHVNRFLSCYKTSEKCRRKHSKKMFLSFIFNNLLMQRAEVLNLDIRKRAVKKFLRTQLIIISKKLNFKIRRLSS